MAVLTTRMVQSPTDAAIPELKRIYHESIPLEECFDDSAWEQTLGGDTAGEDALLVLAAEADQNPCGLAWAWLFRVPEQQGGGMVGYLAALAVDSRQRCQGTGSQLYRDLLAHMREASRLRGQDFAGMMFEVENPIDATDSADRAIRERRLAWYQRLGAKVLDVPSYVQPSLGEGLPEIPFLLLFHPAQREMTPRVVCELLYSLVYGRGPEDALVRRAIESCPR